MEIDRRAFLASIGGRKVWLHGDRNGHLYSIDRTNGKCNWVVPIARVNWVTGFGENCRPIVNPDKVRGVNSAGATALQTYLLAPATQAKIRAIRAR